MRPCKDASLYQATDSLQLALGGPADDALGFRQQFGRVFSRRLTFLYAC